MKKSNLSVLLFLLFFELFSFSAILYSQCPQGYSLRDVKCGNKFTSKCLPDDYNCKDCWVVEWEPCPGKKSGGSWRHSTYALAQADAERDLAGNIFKTCEENPNEWKDKTKWKIYLSDCGGSASNSESSENSLSLQQRIERLKQKLEELIKATFNNSTLGKLYNDLLALRQRLNDGDLTQSEAYLEMQELESSAKMAGVNFSGSAGAGGQSSGSASGSNLPQNGTVGNMTWYRNPNGSYQITLNNTNSPPMNYSAAEAEKIIKKARLISANGGQFNATSHQSLTNSIDSGNGIEQGGTSENVLVGAGQGQSNLNQTNGSDATGPSNGGSASAPSNQYEIPQSGSFGNLAWHRFPNGSYQLTITNDDMSEGMMYSKSEAEAIIRSVIKKYNGRPFNVSSHDDLGAKASSNFNPGFGATNQQSVPNSSPDDATYKALEAELNRIASNGYNVTEADANRLMNLAQGLNYSGADLNRLMQQNQITANPSYFENGNSNFRGSTPNPISPSLNNPNPLNSGFGSNPLNSPLNSYSGTNPHNEVPNINRESGLVMSGISGYGNTNETLSNSAGSIQMNQMSDRFKQISESNLSLQDKGFEMMREASTYSDLPTNITGSALGLGVAIAGAVQEQKEKEAAAEAARLKRYEEHLKFKSRDTILSKESLKWPSALHKSSTVFLFLIGWSNLDYERFEFFVSDVIPIQKNADGSWPFKDKVEESIYKNATYISNKKVVGFFASADQAYNYLESLINTLKKTDLKKITTIQVKQPENSKPTMNQSPSAPSNSSEDFWNN